MLASSVTAFASAGIVGDTKCCCPDAKTCKCHDHDGAPRPDSEMKRCSTDAELVTVELTAAIAVEPVLPAIETRLATILVHTILPMPPSLHDRPEKPPS
jgi:hypothetical protein